MAALRKANAYSKKKVTPFTRKSKVRSKSYIRMVPNQMVVKFHMGDEQAFNNGKLPFHLTLEAAEKIQLRSNAIYLLPCLLSLCLQS